MAEPDRRTVYFNGVVWNAPITNPDNRDVACRDCGDETDSADSLCDDCAQERILSGNDGG